MKIESFKIQNYKKIQNLDMKLDPGINVIVGNNEAGKSTISQAFLDILFVDPSTKAQTFVNRVKPWGSSTLPKLEMVFNALGSKYLFSKDFAKKTVIFENLDTKRKVENFKDSLVNIKKMTGISSEQIFRKTAFISQGDVAIIDSSDDLLHEITNESDSSSAQSGAKGVIKKLQLELNLLNRGLDRPTNSPGPIKAQQDRIANLTKFLEDRKKLWEKKQTASEVQSSSGSELEQLKAEIEGIQELLRNHKVAKQGKSDLIEVEKQLESLEEKLIEVDNLQKNIDELEGNIKKYKNLESKNLEEGIKSIAGLEQTLKHQEDELEKLPQADQISPEKQTKVISANKKILIYPAVMIVFIIVSVWNYFSTRSIASSAILLSLGVLVTLVLVVWEKLNSRTSSKEPEVVGKQSYQKLTESLQQSIQKNKEELAQVLNEFSVSSASEFYSLKADYLSLRTQLDDVRSRQKVLLEGKSLEELKKHQVDLMLKKKEIENTVLTEIVKNSEMSPEKYLEKSRELDKVEIKKQKLEEEVIVSRTRISDSDVEYSEIVALEEELLLAKSRLSSLIKKQKVLSLAIETMKEAVSEVARSANTLLADSIGKHLPVLTNNHYSQVRVNSDLSIEIYANEKNDWVDPIAELSRGTIDQIYFLVRVAFLKVITENKTVPLILDDPFVTADPIRREKFREILGEISKEHQVFLFTNDNDYMDWGNVIQLP